MHVGTLKDDTECGYATNMGWCLCVMHVSFIAWTTLSLAQLTSGHTVRDHDGLVAWEAVCMAGG